MDKRTIHGIDPTAPGGIEALMAFHRQTFGDAVMEADGDEGDGGDDSGDEGNDADSQEGSEGSEGSEGDGEGLGEKGQKALDRMKAERKAAQREAREAKAEVERLKAEAANKDKPDDEKAIETAKQEAAREATEKANQRILRSEVKAAAAGKLADTSDAARFLDLEEFEVDENGDVDEEAIADAISDLLKRKPYLAAQGNQTQFDSARGKPKPQGQVTKEEIKTMSPQAIEKARKEGRLATLLGK